MVTFRFIFNRDINVNLAVDVSLATLVTGVDDYCLDNNCGVLAFVQFGS